MTAEVIGKIIFWAGLAMLAVIAMALIGQRWLETKSTKPSYDPSMQWRELTEEEMDALEEVWKVRCRKLPPIDTGGGNTDDALAYTLAAAGIGGFMFGEFSPTVSAILLVGGLLLAKKPLKLW